MSIKLMTRVWECQFSHSEQSVLLALADHADDDGLRVFPSMALVAWKTGFSKRQVQRIMHILEEKKIITKVKAARQHRATEYRLDLSNAVPKPEFRSDALSPLDDSRGDISSARGDISSARGDIAMSPESPLDPSKTTVKGKATPPARPPAVEAYRAATNAYPVKALWPVIDQLVGREPEKVELWGSIAAAWVLRGWNPRNIGGMTDYFKQGKVPNSTRGPAAKNPTPGAGGSAPALVTGADGVQRAALTPEQVQIKAEMEAKRHGR